MSARRGFTLVEMLVVITIIGILAGLLLPAVNAAREAGRRAFCANQLKQLGLGCKQHESAQGWFPTGGWSATWAGDPDQGFGRTQCGGWCYNVLPYISEQPTHDLGMNMAAADKKNLLKQAAQASLPGFICPTRRAAQLYPVPDYCNSNSVPLDSNLGAHTDYAANTGYFSTTSNSFDQDAHLAGMPIGPSVWVLLSSWAGPTYNGAPTSSGDPSMTKFPGFATNANPALGTWPDYSTTWNESANGVIYPLSAVTANDISDGLANTFLLGEKYLDTRFYRSGKDPADGQAIFAGFDFCFQRYTASPPAQDQSGLACCSTAAPPPGSNKSTLLPASDWFGSAHPGGLNFVMCDGSGRWISYSIDPLTYSRLGNRRDGKQIDPSKL